MVVEGARTSGLIMKAAELRVIEGLTGLRKIARLTGSENVVSVVRSIVGGRPTKGSAGKSAEIVGERPTKGPAGKSAEIIVRITVKWTVIRTGEEVSRSVIRTGEGVSRSVIRAGEEVNRCLADLFRGGGELIVNCNNIFSEM